MAAGLTWPRLYWSLAYSALACMRIGISGSAPFQRFRNSAYAVRAFVLSPWSARARPNPNRASAASGKLSTTPRPVRSSSGFPSACSGDMYATVPSVVPTSVRPQQGLGLERLPLDGVLQSPAIEKLHHDERLSILVADVMNGADVWMVEGGGSERFALEALQRLRILSQVRGEKLQGYVPVQPRSSASYTTPMPPPPSSRRT